MTTKHTQCTMKHGDRVQTAWIDSKLAKVGHFVMLKDGHQWEQGWEITQAGTTLDSEQVAEQRDAYRHHRKNTDV